MTKLTAGGLVAAGIMSAFTVSHAWQSRSSKETPLACRGDAVVKQPDLAKDVLLQVQVFDPRGGAGGYRIYRDGRYESRAREAEWAAGTAMTSAQLAAIRSAIQATEPTRLRDRYEPEHPTGDEGHSTIQVDFGLDTAPRRVTVVRPCTVPEVDGFIQRMAEIFKQAQR